MMKHLQGTLINKKEMEQDYRIPEISAGTVELSQKEKNDFRNLYKEITVSKEGVFQLDVNITSGGGGGGESNNNRASRTASNVGATNNFFKKDIYEKLKFKKQISGHVVEEIEKLLSEIDYANYGAAYDALVNLINFMEQC